MHASSSDIVGQRERTTFRQRKELGRGEKDKGPQFYMNLARSRRVRQEEVVAGSGVDEDGSDVSGAVASKGRHQS